MELCWRSYPCPFGFAHYSVGGTRGAGRHDASRHLHRFRMLRVRSSGRFGLRCGGRRALSEDLKVERNLDAWNFEPCDRNLEPWADRRSRFGRRVHAYGPKCATGVHPLGPIRIFNLRRKKRLKVAVCFWEGGLYPSAL